MYLLLVCWRLSLTSKVRRSKLFPISILAIATFVVIATIACTAAKAFEEPTWTAFAILLVVSIQVPRKLYNLSPKMLVLMCFLYACASPAVEKPLPGLVVLLRWAVKESVKMDDKVTCVTL